MVVLHDEELLANRDTSAGAWEGADNEPARSHNVAEAEAEALPPEARAVLRWSASPTRGTVSLAGLAMGDDMVHEEKLALLGTAKSSARAESLAALARVRYAFLTGLVVAVVAVVAVAVAAGPVGLVELVELVELARLAGLLQAEA